MTLDLRLERNNLPIALVSSLLFLFLVIPLRRGSHGLALLLPVQARVGTDKAGVSTDA